VLLSRFSALAGLLLDLLVVRGGAAVARMSSCSRCASSGALVCTRQGVGYTMPTGGVLVGSDMNTAAASPATQAPGFGRPRRPRRIGHRLARGSLALLALVCVLAAAGAAYQAAATEADRRALPAPGQLVDVGGYRLHLRCLGAGSPTVVLESALGAGSSVWGWVQPGIADVTRVCAYDRAGEGWSDLGPAPRDAAQVAGELHTLLRRAGVGGPLVLVGHSFGGLYARAYAGRYPEQVVGMVLVDASHPDQWTRTADGAAIRRANQISAAAAPWLARLGILRLSGYMKIDPELPPRQQAEMRAFTNGTRLWESYAAVFRVADQTMAEVRESGTFGAMPLIVLTATEHGFSAEVERLHQQLQAELVGLSARGRQQVVAGATHVSLVDSREQAHITVQSIKEILQASVPGAR
jgi:pimeloyl-ACP methyl ester carboxylesterase